MPQTREFDAKKAERLNRDRRHFTPDLLGPPCPVCKTPIVTPLIDAGVGVHPCCQPEHADYLAALESQ